MLFFIWGAVQMLYSLSTRYLESALCVRRSPLVFLKHLCLCICSCMLGAYLMALVEMLFPKQSKGNLSILLRKYQWETFNTWLNFPTFSVKAGRSVTLALPASKASQSLHVESWWSKNKTYVAAKNTVNIHKASLWWPMFKTADSLELFIIRKNTSLSSEWKWASCSCKKIRPLLARQEELKNWKSWCSIQNIWCTPALIFAPAELIFTSSVLRWTRNSSSCHLWGELQKGMVKSSIVLSSWDCQARNISTDDDIFKKHAPSLILVPLGILP